MKTLEAMEVRREAAIKSHLLRLFTFDINNSRYIELSKLYEAAHITNSMLIEQLNRHTAALTSFYNSIYVDIAYILISEIYENSELEELFRSLYNARYPEAAKKVQSIGSCSNKNAMVESLSKAVRHYLPREDPALLKNPEFAFFCYCAYQNDVIWDSGVFPSNIISADQEIWEERQECAIEYTINDYHFVFSDTGEEVFKSKMFDKLIARSRVAMSDYLKIKESTLNDYFHDALSNNLVNTDLSYAMKPGIPGYANMSSLHVIQDNYGASTWIHAITGSRGVRKGGFGYRPNIDKIMRAYYRARVEDVYVQRVSGNDDFPKITFLRDCMTKYPKEDFQAICYLYNIDVVYQMYRKMQERYYWDFSWEQVTHKNNLVRNDNVIKELRDVVKDKERKTDSLQREIRILNERLLRSEDKEAISQLKEEQRLNRIIDEKIEEIVALKERLQTQSDLIELLQKEPDEDPSEQDIDVKALQGKRYLFVGYENTFPELNKVFPDSVFMYNDRSAISNIQVDAVIMLVRYMSHSMLFKVKSTKQLQDIPVVYCCGTGINSIYRDIFNADIQSMDKML